MTLFGFKKSERMTSVKAIEQLFGGGSRSASAFPVRAVYRHSSETEEPVNVLISVSKRHFHHAVDRNRAKRQIREAYRLNKDILLKPLTEKQVQISLAFLWMADEPQPSAKVNQSICRLLQSIAQSL
jgi:ribonuclease P protein component